METKTEKAGITEVEERRDQEGSRKKVRRVRKEEAKDEKGSRSKHLL